MKKTKHGIMLPHIEHGRVNPELPASHFKSSEWFLFSDAEDGIINKINKALARESKAAYHTAYATAVCEVEIDTYKQGDSDGDVHITSYDEANGRVYGQEITLSTFQPPEIYTDKANGEGGHDTHRLVSVTFTLTYANGSTIERVVTK